MKASFNSFDFIKVYICKPAIINPIATIPIKTPILSLI